MPGKPSQSIRLAPALEEELQRLVGTFYGDKLSEVITFILKDWLHQNARRNG